MQVHLAEAPLENLKQKLEDTKETYEMVGFKKFHFTYNL